MPTPQYIKMKALYPTDDGHREQTVWVNPHNVSYIGERKWEKGFVTSVFMSGGYCLEFKESKQEVVKLLTLTEV